MQGQEEVVLRGPKCQDCGNQAKKECSYFRCRTCCKNKGFQCQTHVKSTWTPVDRRRHGDLSQPSPTTDNQHHFKNQNHKQINPYSGLEYKFPAVTNSMAIFRCVQIRSMDDAVNEMAYQTSVKIGGHVFSGLLYDQGTDDKGDNSSDDQQQNLGLINASIHTNIGATVSSATAHEEPFSTTPPYPFPLTTFRPGMPYFSYPKP